MKRLLKYLLISMLLLFILSGCGSESSDINSSPLKERIQNDTSDYICNILDSEASINTFTVVDGYVEDDKYIATCIVDYENEEMSYLNEFEVTYSASKDDWEIEKVDINSDYDHRRELPKNNKDTIETDDVDEEDTEDIDEEDTEEVSTDSSPAEETEDEFGSADLFTVKLDDVIYHIPFEYSKLVENGWVLSDDSFLETTKFESDKSSSVKFSKNGNEIKAWIINKSGNTKELKECMVGGFVIVKGKISDASAFKLYNGVTLDSTVEDIIDVMDEPSFRSEGTSSRLYDSLDYIYTETYTKSVTITIYHDKEMDSKIDIRNFAPDESDTTTVSSDIPEYLDSYVDPEYDTSNGLIPEAYVKLDGHTYRLPCPVSLFIDNGWTIAKQEAVGGGNEDFIVIKKGNDKINLKIKNFADYLTLGQNCAVIRIAADSKTIKTKALIDYCGITLGTDEATLLDMIKSSKLSWKTRERNNGKETEFTYYKKNVSEVYIIITLDNDKHKIINMDLSNDEWDY